MYVVVPMKLRHWMYFYSDKKYLLDLNSEQYLCLIKPGHQQVFGFNFVTYSLLVFIERLLIVPAQFKHLRSKV